MDPIRIACVRYLNTVPLVSGLDRLEGLTLLRCAPAQIADKVLTGEADLGLASIVDALSRPSDTVLFPAGMIGCEGPTLTVRVYSRCPLREATTLAADVESHTSVMLARLILKRTLGVSPAVTPYRELEPWPETVLLIGDKAILGHPPESEYPHQLDLGLAWHELTGLPFVYAMWMARADAVGNGRARLAAAILDRQRRHNACRMEWLVQSHAPGAGWPVETARHYLQHLLRYEVTPRAFEAIDLFASMLAREEILVGARTPRVDAFDATSAMLVPPAAR
ncbi:MAG: menaquinone biosynthetic enzyme MqnA/MqnD family protein [Phycisphaerales bacterium]